MENLGITLGYLLLQICMFAIVFVVMRAWVYKPVVALLEKRREKIAQGLEDARIAAEARSNAEKEAGQIISDANAKAAVIIREATERAEAANREVKTQAETEAAKTRQQALQDFEIEKNAILSGLRSQVAALAISAAQKLVGEELDEKRQHTLLDEFFSGVRKGKVVVLEGGSMTGGSAEVVSALPLTTAEQESVKKDVLSRMGGGSTVTFRVDPSILGGLVIRAGDKVVDGSVAGQLQALRQTLK